MARTPLVALAACVLVHATARAAPPAGSPPSSPSPPAVTFMAMPLLDTATLPSPDAIVRSYDSIAPKGAPRLVVDARDDRHGHVGRDDAAEPGAAVTLRLGDTLVVVGLVPRPVPGGEADAAAAASLVGFLDDWRPAPHIAHLIVVVTSEASRPRRIAHGDFVRVLAAVTSASRAVAVYVGGAGVTVPADVLVAGARQEPPLVAAHCGFERRFVGEAAADAKTPPARFGLMSHCMSELGLDELYLTAPLERAADALAFFVDLLGYVVRRGAPLPDGDTVGRSADEKLPVRYEPVPGAPSARVWRVDMR